MCAHSADIVMATEHLSGMASELFCFSGKTFPTLKVDGLVLVSFSWACSCLVGKSPGKPQASLRDASLLAANSTRIVTR